MLNKEDAASRVIARNHVVLAGQGTVPMIFAHGFGSDQRVWGLLTPSFEQTYRIVTFDHVGSGRSDITAYRRAKYSSLQGYADDLLEICEALELERAIYVGHSVSAMIGVLAANREPARFSHLIMLGPSPRFLNDGDYVGGYTPQDIDGVLSLLDSNQEVWCEQLMLHALTRQQAEELANAFCNANAGIMRHFAQVAYTSDLRADAAKCATDALIVQSGDDAIVPACVGEYLHRTMPNNTYVVLENLGHLPQLTAPAQTAGVMQAYLNERRRV